MHVWGSSGFMVSGFNGVVLVQEEVAFGVDKSGLPKKGERRTAEERSWKGGVLKYTRKQDHFSGFVLGGLTSGQSWSWAN